MQGREVVGQLMVTQEHHRAAPGPFAFSSNTQVLHTDEGLLYPTNENRAPPLPEVDSDVTIIEWFDRFLITLIYSLPSRLPF